MKSLFIALAALALFPITVDAGGGTKANVTVNITNGGTEQLAVIFDPPAGLNTNDLNAFRAAGGRILNANETSAFSVKVGSHLVAGAFINAAAQAAGTIGTFNVNAQRNQALTIRVTGNNTVAPTFTIQ